MTEDKDPILQARFADTWQDFAAGEFTKRVMMKIHAFHQRTIMIWVSAGLLLAAFVWLIATPLRQAINLLTQSLTLSLIEIDNGLLAEFLSPVNNSAMLVVIGFFGLRLAYRKIFL